MPVQVAAQQAGVPVAADRLSGTLWAGQVSLEGGHLVRWQGEAGASLRAGAVVAGWTVTGPGTALTGRVALRPGSARISAVEGGLGWPLVAALMPGLRVRCDMGARVPGLALVLARGGWAGEGQVTTAAGACVQAGDTVPVPVPALTLGVSTLADGMHAVLTTTADPGTPLATVRVTTADRVVITLHRAGAAMVPGMPSSEDSELDLPLSALAP